MQDQIRTDIQNLESMFLVQVHAAERTLRVIENLLAEVYKADKDYKKLVKLYGKTTADQIVAATVHRELTHDETYNIGKLLEECRKLQFLMERLTDASTAVQPGTTDAGKKQAALFDALLHDANLLAYRHALMCCVRPEDDIKVDSTLRALAKDHTIREDIINQFKMSTAPENK